MTYTYFETEIKTVKINGVEIECEVVNSITHSRTPIDNLMPIPNGYDENILNMAYLPNENPIFQQIDVEETEQPTTLDDVMTTLTKVNNNTSTLLADIKAETIDEFTMELLENGLL